MRPKTERPFSALRAHRRWETQKRARARHHTCHTASRQRVRGNRRGQKPRPRALTAFDRGASVVSERAVPTRPKPSNDAPPRSHRRINRDCLLRIRGLDPSGPSLGGRAAVSLLIWTARRSTRATSSRGRAGKRADCQFYDQPDKNDDGLLCIGDRFKIANEVSFCAGRLAGLLVFSGQERD